MSYPITVENFKEFAIDSYTNPQCLGIDEFKADFIKLLRLNRSIESFQSDRDKGMAVRLLLNTFICLANVFEPKSMVRMVMFKARAEHIPVAMSVFEFMNILPLSVPEIDLNKYRRDEDLFSKLRGL